MTCQFIFLTADFVSLFKVLISGLMTWFNIYIYIYFENHDMGLFEPYILK